VKAAGPATAIYVGDRKLIHCDANEQNLLFNLRADMGERTDLATQQPTQVAEPVWLINTGLLSVDAGAPRARNRVARTGSDILGVSLPPSHSSADDQSLAVRSEATKGSDPKFALIHGEVHAMHCPGGLRPEANRNEDTPMKECFGPPENGTVGSNIDRGHDSTSEYSFALHKI